MKSIGGTPTRWIVGECRPRAGKCESGAINSSQTRSASIDKPILAADRAEGAQVNGTYLNGTRIIDDMMISDGDQIAIGQQRIGFEASD
jgi:hypothetical protein